MSTKNERKNSRMKLTDVESYSQTPCEVAGYCVPASCPAWLQKTCYGERDADASVIEHWKICEEANALYTKKRHDYGDSFHKTFEEEGFAMARIRLTDKLERFKTLTRTEGAYVSDESLEDTLIDMINYAAMTIMELRRWKGQEA